MECTTVAPLEVGSELCNHKSHLGGETPGFLIMLDKYWIGC